MSGVIAIICAAIIVGLAIKMGLDASNEDN